jgi:hypothetical protein
MRGVCGADGVPGLESGPSGGEASGTGAMTRGRGIHFDVGTAPDGVSSRPLFDPEVVAREMQIIARDLHATAVRISGGELDRLVVAAGHAARNGLEVWLSPHPCELDETAMAPYFLDCARHAERLRRDGARVVLVTGCELSLFAHGYLPGASFSARTQTLTGPPERRAEALAAVPGPVNGFLAATVAAARSVFAGPITYASIPIEHVDWSPFDIVGLDAYRSSRNTATYRDDLRRHVATGKPAAVTEVGCCTYRGAADLGAAGWLVLQPDGAVTPGAVRDEHEQVRYLRDLLPIFDQEGVDTAFWFTLAAYTLTHRPDPHRDSDMGSYGITKIIEEGASRAAATRAYPGVPWEPKAAFHALAEHYALAER